MNDHLVVVQSGLMGNRFAWIFGGAGELEGFRPVEGCCVSDFARFFAVDLLAWVRRLG